ncbi:McrB family protein [Bacillus tropicus]|uniref:McrB family protein n=1 Tax=Bacillus tropicus TaxID=2026188 RepID=UPI0035E08779
MAENVIYYGPPGTGKTFIMQSLQDEYLDFEIEDRHIVDVYQKTSNDWLLITLIILQNDNKMQSMDIQNKVGELGITNLDNEVSTVLELHSLEKRNSPFPPREPTVFIKRDNEWSVRLTNLLKHMPNIHEEYLPSGTYQERYKYVTFHQAFSYEDFIEGIRPVLNETTTDDSNGMVKYKVVEGVFKQICEDAEQNPDKEYALFIDEINRGNISEIFGELISLIEEDKRLGAKYPLEIVLPYSKKKFGVPSNLNIYGTMNSADRSIALLDIALRRRFKFIFMGCDLKVLEKTLISRGLDPSDIEGISLIRMLDTINKRIELLLDANFVIGHAFFINVNNFDEIKHVLVQKVIPLLQEYFFGEDEKVQMILGDLDASGELMENAIYKHEILDAENLIAYLSEFNIEDKKRFSISDTITVDSIVKIYE